MKRKQRSRRRLPSIPRACPAAAGLLLLLAAAGCRSEARRPVPLPELDPESRKIAEALPAEPTAAPREERRLLVFSRCEGYRHESIPTANKAIGLMGRRTGAFEVEFSTDPAAFDAENLERFDAVLLNNTTRLSFEDPARRKALLDFVRNGGGLVGIHAAADNFYTWPEGAEMLGGIFDGHPWGAGGTWAVKIDEPDHPLCRAFGRRGFLIRDEIYQFKAPYARDKLRVLLSLDMTNPRNQEVQGIHRGDGDFAVSWIRRFGKGRVFYCSLGHEKEVYRDPAVLRHYLDGIQYALGDLPADDRPSAAVTPPPTPARTTDPGGVDDPFLTIRTFDFGKSRYAASAIEDRIRAADPAERKAIAGHMVEVLRDPEATFRAKQFACRMLRRLGGTEALATLSMLLRDERLHDAARFALEGLASPEVDRIFRRALDELEGPFKLGLIGSIARRRDRAAVPALAALAGVADPDLSRTAVDALGRIGGGEAAAALQALTPPDRLAPARDEAMLRCADDLAAEGKTPEALTLYHAVEKAGSTPPLRAAAAVGLLRAAGPEAPAEAVRYLTADEPVIRDAAGRFLAELPAGTDLSPLILELGNLPPEAQVRMLDLLAFRKERAALPAVERAAGAADATVRTAALAALGDLGGPEQVMLLAEAAAAGGAPGRAAAESLSRLPGRAVDAALTAAVRTAAGPVRAALIRALSDRGTPGTLPLFLGYTKAPDPRVRRAALEALEKHGEASVLPALVERLTAPDFPEERGRIERTLRAVCSRVEKKDTIAEVLRGRLANASPASRASLYRLLGAFPSDAGFEALRAGLEDEDPAARAAALRALGAWPDPRPAALLLRAAGPAENGDVRALALRGYLHAVCLRAGKDPQADRAAFQAAADAARTTQEKAMVLGALASVMETWVPALLEPYRADPALRARADAIRDRVIDGLAKKVPHAARGRPVTLNFPYAEKYAAGGPGALTDGKYGSKDFHDGRWQGFEGKDLAAVVDLGTEIPVERIRVGFLEDLNSWIFFPRSVDMALSKDGRTYEQVAHFETKMPGGMRDPSIKEFTARIPPKTARYVRITARNVGVCPPWHPGNGGKAWIFADEIQVNPCFGP